ncbi:hypothetical protein H0194_02005 [Corynebacterium incognita]|uniref:Uncharacterized protein n=1 Tax=Corynebacterium incognita TaxID=2754725 RepID=A0A7G7CQI0_9CORY|nr:hypothetical protein [Corynebacterium incognita]QNE89846.1 hypothetical protein H0194_02005 [Corynebacterium incognita]
MVKDEFEVISHWKLLWGGKIDNSDHALSLVELRFALSTEVAPDLETLSMKAYAAIREVIRGYKGVEYFSMFGEDLEVGGDPWGEK